MDKILAKIVVLNESLTWHFSKPFIFSLTRYERAATKNVLDALRSKGCINVQETRYLDLNT